MKKNAELFNELKIDSDIENFITKNGKEFLKPFHKYLSEILRDRNLTKKQIAFELNVDASYIHHIFFRQEKGITPPAYWR